MPAICLLTFLVMASLWPLTSRNLRPGSHNQQDGPRRIRN